MSMPGSLPVQTFSLILAVPRLHGVSWPVQTAVITREHTHTTPRHSKRYSAKAAVLRSSKKVGHGWAVLLSPTVPIQLSPACVRLNSPSLADF